MPRFDVDTQAKPPLVALPKHLPLLGYEASPIALQWLDPLIPNQTRPPLMSSCRHQIPSHRTIPRTHLEVFLLTWLAIDPVELVSWRAAVLVDVRQQPMLLAIEAKVNPPVVDWTNGHFAWVEMSGRQGSVQLIKRLGHLAS